jgi:hypothetical protein
VARKKEAEHKALLLEEGPVSTTAMKAIEDGKKRVQLETEQRVRCSLINAAVASVVA